MQINVAQLVQESVGTKREYQVSEAFDVLGDGNSRLVEGEIRLLRTNRSILVMAAVRTEVELTCSRCLGVFNSPLPLNFEEEYIPTTDMVSGARVSQPEEPGIFTIDEHHVINLTEAMCQYAMMAVSMKPLCREDCAGLCRRCGRNLNLGQCNCPVP